MKVKQLLLMGIIMLGIKNSNAQQIFSISQFIQHNFIYNPAAAGANEYASVGATYKKMWSGIEGGPQTTILFGDKYFKNSKTGLGVVLYNDVTGPISRTGGDINLSYSIPFSDKKKLMFGVAGQFLQESIDKAQIEKYIPGDPLLAGPGSYFTGDAAAGVYYTSSTLNLGFSAKQLVQSKLDFIKTSTLEEGRLYRHYYLMGSYNWKTDEDNVIVPNFIVKLSAHAPIDIEAGCRIEHKDLIWGGFNFHYKQNFSAFAGIKLNHKLAIGYAYDQYTTPLSTFSAGGGAHEIMLRLYFIKK
jgi:type IX secretion system PorP/SprF family membrane protein